jgi:hypothetical protein
VNGIFLDDGTAKGFVLTMRNPVVSRLEVLWNRTEMLCRFNLERAEEGTWR